MKKTVENLVNGKEIISGYEDRFISALTSIAKGGAFNGTVYAKRVSSMNRDISVYVDGKYISLGRHYRDNVEEVKSFFLGCVSKLKNTNQESDNDLVDTGLGFSARRKDVARVSQFGYDGIEADQYY